MKKISDFLKRNAHFVAVLIAILSCAFFLSIGHLSKDGQYITLNSDDVRIYESTEKIIEDSRDALWRIMNEETPTDEETIKANEEVGLGGSVTLDQVIARRLPDGDNDGGRGWQCSKYTAYLATGKREYSSSHPDYGPVNGKDVASWLVKNYGWKYISTPVQGAIGSGGFNTTYGHTVMYLYPTGAKTAMVNDANWTPLTVSTHNMDITDWVWVVPGDYTPSPTPAPTPVPVSDNYTVKKGETLGEIARKLGWYTGDKMFGDDGYAQSLADYNNIPNRGLIYPGQTIRRK